MQKKPNDITDLGEYSYEVSKSRQMYFKSKIEESSYHEITGKTIPMTSIIQYMESVGGQLKTSLHQLPDRLASRLSHESDEQTIYDLIMSEIEEVYRQVEVLLDQKNAASELRKGGKKPFIKSGKVSSHYK